MKYILTFTLTVSALLLNNMHQTSSAAIEATKPEASSAKQDTPPTWIVQISPAPGLDSYATREFQFPLTSEQEPVSTTEKANHSIIIVPRDIPSIPAKPACADCDVTKRRPLNRSAYCNSWPWSRNSYFTNLQSNPSLYMYSDLVRSNWFGSPYRGHSFYYNGYRPSFRFGSLQYRGFGDYDRMYNPRIIPFGYQLTGSRGFYAALALAEQYGF